MREAKRKFVVSIDSISDWYEDHSEVAYTFSCMPKSEAYALLSEENEQKTESTKWEDENLPKQVTIVLDRNEEDEIDLSDLSAEHDLIVLYEDEIAERCTDYARDKLCQYDMVLPEGCDWHIVSCDDVVLEKPESEEGEDEGSRISEGA